MTRHRCSPSLTLATLADLKRKYDAAVAGTLPSAHRSAPAKPLPDVLKPKDLATKLDVAETPNVMAALALALGLDDAPAN